MTRKQLEQCAWDKTPRDQRRAQKERYDWKAKKSAIERLAGNAREVRVFDPSGSTEGTMSPWVPLWSLYSDELEQRCKEEREPKLRSPYSRGRSDYTGDVESSPIGRKTRAQLDAEIAAALAERTSGRSHSTIGRHVALKPWPGSEVQSLLFDKQWTVPEAKDWARNHGYKHGKVHETEGYIRLRQFDPIAGTEKRTVTFGQGIKAIIEQVK